MQSQQEVAAERSKAEAEVRAARQEALQLQAELEQARQSQTALQEVRRGGVCTSKCGVYAGKGRVCAIRGGVGLVQGRVGFMQGRQRLGTHQERCRSCGQASSAAGTSRTKHNERK